MRGTSYDWGKIQAYYEAGHTVRECQERFGFSRGAWYSAVGRGDVVPDHNRLPRFSHETRKAVGELLNQGLSQTEVAFQLGLSKGTVCYHARQLGLRGDERFARRYDWAHTTGTRLRALDA